MIYTPLPHQPIARRWLDEHDFAMLWMGCGLGKTVVVLDKIVDLIADGSKGVLIIAPLRVARITWPAQVERWDHTRWLRIVNLTTKEGERAWEEGSADIYITNPERLPSIERTVKGVTRRTPGHAERFLRRKHVPVDTLVVDECFPPGTKVDTPNGPVEIELLKKGDCILNVTGKDSVVETHKNEVHEVALIKTSDGRSIISSTTHKFFTQRGWVAAQEAKETDCILSRRTAVRLLQGDLCEFLEESESEILRIFLFVEINPSEEENASPASMSLVQSDVHPKGSTSEEVLRDFVLREMEVRHLPSKVNTRAHRETNRFAPCMVSRGESRSRSREEKNYRNASDDEPRNCREVESHFKADRPQGKVSWGERTAVTSGSEITLGHLRRGVDAGICGEDIGEERQRVSLQLQDRHCESRYDGSDRGGWEQSCLSPREATGCEEEREADFVRVDSVEILQQGDPRLDQFRDAEGRIYFYDITAARHPSYSVEGLLVHNCSLAKNHASRRFNSLRAYNHHFKRRWGLTGTPIPNSYLDVFAQTRLIDDGERFGRSFTQFRERYFESDYMGFKYTLRPGAKEQIDEKLKDLALVLRSSDYLDIPDTRVEDVEVTLCPAAEKAYRTLEKEYLLQLERGEIVALNAAALTNKLLQLAGGVVYDADKNVHEVHDSKLVALEKLLKIHKGEPVLVLTAFIHEIDRVLKRLPGAVQFHEKHLGDWGKGRIKVMVANPGQMSHGIDGMQNGGRIIVWLTPTYDPQKYHQTNARLARTGQGQETLVYRIVVKGGIDEAVVETLRDKEETQNSAMLALKNLQRLKKG